MSVLVVIAQPRAGGLNQAEGESLGLGASLAGALGEPLACAVIGHDVAAAASEAAERGAASVYSAAAAHLERFSGDATVAAAAEAAKAAGASTVIVARGANSLELAPRLGARLGSGCVMGVGEFRTEGGHVDAVASVFGGAARAVFRMAATPRVVALAPGVATAPEREAGRSAEVTALDVPAPAEERVTVEQPGTLTGPRLEDAKVVVSGGRGLQSGDNFGMIRELAEALGGLPGASRAIVDDGWAPAEEQVGLTGKIVSPDLYIAAGISGASQHMVGCSTARVLVGINSDAGAPIFRYARYGIAGDCLEVLPELIRLSRASGAGTHASRLRGHSS